MNPLLRIGLRITPEEHRADMGSSVLATKEKGRAPSGCPPLLPLGNLPAAAAVQQAVVVEALTTAGLAVLVYVNWHCAGVVAAVT